MGVEIDTSFDFRSDAKGRDPDTASKTLRNYHQILWSKPLPYGSDFQLIKGPSPTYLQHDSPTGIFKLGSDSIIHSFANWKRTAPIIAQIPQDEIDTFRKLSYTIGGFVLFPNNRIGTKPTINGARGMNRKICDRFDLSLECIRLFYKGINNPLTEVLERYHDFFELFGGFKNYVEFFLLQDLVSNDFNRINFFLPFENFDSPPMPEKLDSYMKYKDASINFVIARNKRIEQWVSQNYKKSM